MKYDDRGVAYISTAELCELLYQQPDLELSRFNVTDPLIYNRAVDSLYADMPRLREFNLIKDCLLKSLTITIKVTGTCQMNITRWISPLGY